MTGAHDIGNDVKIAVTLGDPAGIGPEIVAKALTQGEAPTGARFLVVGPARHLQSALSSLGERARLRVTSSPENVDWQAPGIAVLEPPRAGGFATLSAGGFGGLTAGEWPKVAPGAVSAQGGEAAYQAVALAVRMAMAGSVDAICTAPLHKKALNLAGYRYPGHTEILAEIAGAKRAVMLLQGGGLRVTMVTIHIALSDVPSHITESNVLETIRITNAALIRDWAIARPRVAVTGLNPHAGDSGLWGNEETSAIAPAIATARREGVDATGPWPADTVFHQMLRGSFDAVVAMYHDQALIPIKTLAFDEGVNITLGLPFIRTSVDHGTAMDIAGRNEASPRSLLCALRDAVSLARSRRRQRIN